MATFKIPMSLRELSHELRTPLTGILGRSYNLSQEPLTEEQRACVEDICQAGNRLLATVELIISKTLKILTIN